MILDIYARVSRKGSRGDKAFRSPDIQREECLAEIQRLGHEWSGEFFYDEDKSGSKLRRPEFDRVIERIGDGTVAGVMVYNSARFMRSAYYSFKALREIEGVDEDGNPIPGHQIGRLFSASDRFDLTRPEGRAMFGVMAVMAQLEWEQKSEGFASAKAGAVAAGKHIGPTPFGYLRTEDGLVPDPEREPIVVGLFERRAAGASWKALQDWMQSVGHGMSEGGVKTVIRNRVYLGEVGSGVYRNASAHDAIVSRELWEAAQLQHPRPPRGTNGPALLAGIVRCAGCGYTMSPSVGRGKNGPARTYVCKRRHASGTCKAPTIILGYLVEPLVERALHAVMEGDRFAASERNRRLDDALAALSTAEGELAAYRDEPLIASTLGAVEFAKGLKPRVDAVEAAKREVGLARTAAGTLPNALTFAEAWDDLTVEERRSILRDTFGAVWVRRGRGYPEDRVRIVARGFEPAELPRRNGRTVSVMAPFDWGDLPGEVPIPAIEHTH